MWYHATSVEVEGKLETNTEVDLSLLIRQKPNKKSIFWRSFRLDWHNFLGGNQHKIRGNWVSRNYYRATNWLAETIGTPPIIYEEMNNRRTVSMMRDFLKSKGYYFAQVKDSVVVDTILFFNDPKVEVVYKVKPNKPYIIRDIEYDFQDKHIFQYVQRDTVNRKFNRGDFFDATLLQNERVRITDSLKNFGYYKFAKEYLYYSVDKVSENKYLTLNGDSVLCDQVNVTMKLKPYEERINGRSIVFLHHPVFMVKNLYIAPDYDTQRALREGKAYRNQLDTVLANNIYYLQNNKPNLRASTIERGLRFMSGQLYNESKVRSTTQYLNKLSAVKISSVYFTEQEQVFLQDTIKNVRIRFLDPHINVSLASRQSYSIDLEGNYASREYYGLDGSLNYQHKNLFKGSEDFKLKFSTSWANNQIITEEQTAGVYFNTIKYGVDSKLTVPKFFIPAGFDKFSKRYTPQTVFGLGFSFEKRPDFNNQNMQASFGYKWNSTQNNSHYLSPLTLYATQILNISDDYRTTLNQKNLLANFADRLIASVNYTYIYTGRPEHKYDSYSYFHTKLESAGNMLMAINAITNKEKEGNPYFENGEYPLHTSFELPIAQYFQAEIDWRRYFVLHPGKKLVVRLFAGTGIPYGNYPVLPSHKQYLAGGMNSLRGWSAGHVGPGTASYKRMQTMYSTVGELTGENTDLYQQRGEMKLELNLEYRLQVNEMLETAFFFDLGNTWSLSDYNSSTLLAKELNTYIDNGTLTGNRIETKFDVNTFYNQFAYDAGIGLRFDFSFFILRFDLGGKINDPGDGDAGIFNDSGFFRLNNWRLNFGIGHPF